MKKPSNNDADIVGLMNKIQAQLAVLDRKLDAFMTKSLTELAEAKVMAAPKLVHHVSPTPQSSPRPTEQRSTRPMYAAICSHCGKDCEIPFKPSGDRPVYCKECWAMRKSGQGPKSNVEPRPAASLIEPTTSVAKPASTGPTVTPSTSKKKPVAVKKSIAKKKVIVKKKAKKK